MDLLFSFEGTTSESGDDSEVETPVSIPNTVVKHFSGDNSWASPCEDSTLPGNKESRNRFLFLLYWILEEK